MTRDTWSNIAHPLREFPRTSPRELTEAIRVVSLYRHDLQYQRGKTDDWPLMSRPADVSNEYIVCYQDLPEYVGLENIEQGFHGQPALKKHF